jgi:hypothetical protein
MEEYIPLPNFIIFGAAKCGSTSLAQLLAQHPDIYISSRKEPNFFLYEEGEIRPNGELNSLESYQYFFEKRSSKVNKEKARGEASISYLSNKKAPHRIKKLIPDVKLIAILRNPIERCYSQYLFNLRNKVIDDSEINFAQAIIDNSSYIEAGMYFKYLSIYHQVFSAEQIKIVLFDDFVAKQEQLLQDIFRFLEVDDSFMTKPIPKEATSGIPKNKKIYNFIYQPNPVKSVITSMIKPFIPKEIRNNLWKKAVNQSLKKPPMSFAERQKLIEIYREDVLQLQTLIKRDLSHWLTLPNT